MKKILKILLILQILVQTMAFAQPIWNGTADTKWYNKSQTEFSITTPEQLAGLSKLVTDGNRFKGKTVKLGANIMLNDTANWQNWGEKAPKNKWTPIGSDKVSGSMYSFGGGTYYYFEGTFNGNGYTVSGVYINSGSYIGLFGKSFGRIENLGVKASYIKGESYAGGLLGSGGDIINCYSTAWVEGKDNVGGLVGSGRRIIYSYSASIVTGGENVGGLVGANWGEISTSYFTGSVTGKENTGGLAGKNWNDKSSFPCIIKNSYSAGKVKGNKNTGGLVGLNGDKGEIVNSYYDKEISGQSDEGKGVGKTTSEMKQQISFANWDFIFNWGIDGKKNNGYPHLQNLKDETTITTAEQLAAFSQLVSMGVGFYGKTIKLGGNIMLNDTIKWQSWASKPPANKWKPIGTYHNANVSSPFSGTFDGGGFAVSGIYVNSNDGYHEGMFGYLDSNGTIKNLGVTASYIKSGGYVGGLAGNSEGIIDNCYSVAFVEGIGLVGGLAGSNHGTTSNSYFMGKVTGERIVGGFVGENYGKIINSYSTGTVAGKDDVGGFAGKNEEFKVISNSYFIGTVTGETKVGGFVGKNSEKGKIISVYSNSKVVGKDMVGGLAGYSDYSSTIINSYSSGEVTGIGKVGGLVGYSYTSTITSSYSTSNVKGDSLVGGLVGLSQYSATIRNCYSAGKVTGKINAGGFVGADRHNVVIVSSFYDKNASGQNDMGKGAGRTTVEMQSKKFVDSLNLSASLLSLNAWIYKANKYPVLSNETAKASEAKALDIDKSFASGNGTETKPYIINTKKHLENLSWLVNIGNDFKSKFFKLDVNIMLNDTVNWQNWASKPPANEWTPIGTYTTFNGTFEGNGFTISGVYINSEKHSQGLFGYIGSNGTIKNLKIIASFINGGQNVGGLAGTNSGNISDVYVAALTTGHFAVGGLAGVNGGTVSNSHSDGAVTNTITHLTSEPGAGGLVGGNGGTISNSYSASNVTGITSVGGLAGRNTGKISTSYSTGKVVGRGTVLGYVGGLVGNNKEHGATINDSYSTSAVEGILTVGGLAGLNDGVINGSYFNGTVTGKASIGGLLGMNFGKISNSYSLGKVSGQDNVGGLVGTNMKHKVKGLGISKTTIGSVNNSYSVCEVTGLREVGGLVGKSTGGTIKDSYYDDGGKTSAEMKQKSTYEGWDFDKVWGISGEVNGGYPYLLNYNKSLP